MKVYQSYLSAILKGKFSLYEMRLLLEIVRSLQPLMQGVKVHSMISNPICIDGVNLNLSVQIRSVLSDGSKHYDEIKAAARSLESKIVEHYDANTKKWLSSPMIYNVCLDAGTGVIKFSAAKWLMEYIVDMCKGFTVYDFASAMRLSSSYATRLYMIFGSLSRPVSFRIDLLKSILGVEDKYSQTRDFLKRVIDPAIKELEQSKLNGITYSTVYEGRKIVSLQLKPIRRQEQSETELTAMASLSAWCGPVLKSILITRCDFTSKELSAHKSLLMSFGKIPYWQDALMSIIERQRKKRASKGYVIQAMRAVVKEFDGKPQELRQKSSV